MIASYRLTVFSISNLSAKVNTFLQLFCTFYEALDLVYEYKDNRYIWCRRVEFPTGAIPSVVCFDQDARYSASGILTTGTSCLSL